MTSANRAEDARLAVLVLAAEQMYDTHGPHAIGPPVDRRIAANWSLRGYIVGTDAIIRLLGGLALGEQRVFYGLLLQHRTTLGQFAAVIRGTAGSVEWCEDLEGLPKMSRWPGRVESGFQGIYDSFAYCAPGAPEIPLIGAISTAVGAGTLTVVGHSLGSALATYLAYELSSALPGRVALRVWASPHPGDVAFMAAVAATVPNHAHYLNPNDIVPKVPVCFGYTHLANTIPIGPENERVSIKSDWGCSHHLTSYLALMDASSLVEAASPQNEPYLSCIVSPSAKAA